MRERDELLLMVGGSAEPQGELRVTCSTTLGERFLAPIIGCFGERYPRLSITLHLTNRLTDLVGEGYDLAIRTGDITDPRLTGRRVAFRPIETCASPGYLAVAGMPSSIAQLGRHRCLIGTASAWHFRENGVARSFTPSGPWRCNSGSAITDAAIAGRGICQVPHFYVQRAIAAGQLTPILADLRAPPEPVWAVYPSRRHLMPKVRNLVDLLERDLQAAMDGQ